MATIETNQGTGAASVAPVYYFPMAYGKITPESELWAKLEKSPHWILEKKYNEIRCQIHVVDRQLIGAFDRHGHPIACGITPEMIDEIGGPGRGYCVYDCGLRDRKVCGYRQKLVMYDCIRYQGIMLTDTPYRYRLELLPIIEPDRPLNRWHAFGDCPIVGRPVQYPDKWDDICAHLPADPEAEGVVLKNLDGRLKLSRTSNPTTFDVLKWRFAK